MNDYQVISRRLPRIDALSKVTGAAQFLADLKRPGVLVGRVLRSPLPHARIARIDATAAKRLPGVKAAIQARIPRRRRMRR